ncbi:MAG: hypothetical protein KAH18_03170 [Psychromonas sp.]|nr:hypothetical protein [Psychromonas sp.]
MLDAAAAIEYILKSIDAHTVTNLFILLIVGIFIISIILDFHGNNRVLTHQTPNLLTSLGILGTFVGIVIGLLYFDPSHIDQSIELLLNGLQTAFITSLVGMAASIAYRILTATSIFKKNRITDEIIDVQPKDILNAIVNQGEHLAQLKKAISSDNDSSLTAQIKLLRSDVNDNNKQQQQSFKKFSEQLWKSLDEFSKMLAKSATDQVIQALKEVVTDFNKHLTEQFGENFKALDESVKKLVDWQSAYSTQLEDMIKQYSQGVKAIADIEGSVTNIHHSMQAIPDTMSKLATVIEVSQHQINTLEHHLGAFKEMKELAVKALPDMQDHIQKTIENIALSSQKASEGYSTLLENTQDVQNTFTASIQRIQNQIKETTTELLQNQVYEMNNSFSAMERQVEKSVEVTGEAVNKHLKMIDDSMSQEIQRVIAEMGNALARISGQFTQDYQELTNAMKKITKTEMA